MKAIVWSKYHCPYCDQAKALLKAKGYTIEEKKIVDGYTREELLEAVPGARSVPQIFIEEKSKYLPDLNYYIGKYWETA